MAQLKQFEQTGGYAVKNRLTDYSNNHDDSETSIYENIPDGVDPEDDPELVTALKESLETERERQKHNSPNVLTNRSAGKVSTVSWNQKTWKEAQGQVIECRRILKYSYVASHYMQDAPQKALYEDHQAQLQHFTEMLSEQCEKPFEDINFSAVFNLKNVVADYACGILETSYFT